ncbi:MAG: Uma2 family endonuclease [Planctomycetota bacterium]|nr:Uma2 family endonuclease [Planctomycetota bacterium]
MARPQVRFTYEDYRRVPDDGQRHEVLDGEHVVSPAPGRRHQQVLKRLAVKLVLHVEGERRRGEVYFAPFDVLLADDNVVQPDLIFVAEERQALFSERGLEGAPDLVVEVLSPSTRARDRGKKREVYARFGVRELWLVDPDAGTVDLFTLAAGQLAHAGTFGPGDVLVTPLLADLRLDLAAVFA